LQVVGIQAIGSRPLRWYVCIDSNTNISDDFDYEKLIIIIENECGRYPDSEDIEKPDFEYDDISAYPAIDWDGGNWWTDANFGKQKDENALAFIEKGIISIG